MDNLAQRLYTGKGDCHYKLLPKAWQEPEPYIAPQSLVDAVNTALYLRRPLLLEGDPGCGKTRLAYAVAYELGYPLHPCYIRSTSRAQDLLYDYDALGRLYDIQEGKVGDNPTKAPSRQDYVTLGELGNAIAQSQDDIPSVVLIDEIDKADIDFPNDLLLELDRLQFQVKEVSEMRYDALQGKTRKARRDFLPLIIITSNREKELPKPFLRRCLFYYIEFPDQNTLEQILQSHFQPKLTPLFEVAVQKFWELRELRSWRKIPGTSEFLDWVAILEREQQGKKLTAAELASTDPVNLPYLETLVKTQSDREALNKQF
ncbi:MAG: MoxR family ATPase [Symploca sp. SIO1C2]|nr:MoxR family ATPase [Symploca sp. SIO1C2]